MIDHRYSKKRFRLYVGMAMLSCLFGCKTPPSKNHFSYEKNYPIHVGPKKNIFDVSITAMQHGITLEQQDSLYSFLRSYDENVSPLLLIFLPSGAKNEQAISTLLPSIISIVKDNGVAAKNILIKRYKARKNILAPVRFSFTTIKAYTRPCQQWNNIVHNPKNINYPDFGCSYQSNFAAQISNPYDWINPREKIPIDAGTRDSVIENYKKSQTSWSSEISY